jgi:hypothetical protein
MTDVEIERLEARARRAYERGRWRLAVASAWPVLLLSGLCIALGGQPLATACVAIALAVTIVLAVVHGRGHAKAVVPGLLAGALPLLAGLLACRFPHTCGAVACFEFCAPLCLGAGMIAGFALVVRRHRSSASSLWVAGLIALLTGALGCFFVGLGGIGGMLLGVPLGGAVGWIRGTNEA